LDVATSVAVSSGVMTARSTVSAVEDGTTAAVGWTVL